MDWATFWAIFSQTHLVALSATVGRCRKKENKPLETKPFCHRQLMYVYTPTQDTAVD
jgi:hypothetical protein